MFLDAALNLSIYQYLNNSLSSRWSTEIVQLIVVGFNDTSTLLGHFVSSPRKKRYRRDSREDEREGQGREENE